MISHLHLHHHHHPPPLTSLFLLELLASQTVKPSLKKINYNSWSSYFNIHLGSLGLKKHIEEASTSTSMMDLDWHKIVKHIKMWILGTLSESLQDEVVTTLGTAKDLWNHIKTLFYDNEDAQL
uniref:Hybrid signal transduction histidine kinase M n=1 Tax=Tanacetum cinerariifolium TaxID=118510 RepID=A0A699IJ07_TANCI|nr:hybrid signal transduction histidine kinase M [Tanacetum cinerariifolium]